MFILKKGAVIMKRSLVWFMGLFLCATVYAVEYSVDSIAEVREGEIAKFYPNSVRDKFGERYCSVALVGSQHAVPAKA